MIGESLGSSTFLNGENPFLLEHVALLSFQTDQALTEGWRTAPPLLFGATVVNAVANTWLASKRL